MTPEPGEKKPGGKKTEETRPDRSPKENTTNLAILAISSVCFNLVFLTILTDLTPLGPGFKTMVFFSLAIGALTSALFTKLAGPKIQAVIQTAPWKKPLSYVQKTILILGVAAVISAYITAAFIWHGINNLRIEKDLRSDQQAIEATLVGTGFNAARTNGTLAKFQNARRNLEPRLPSGKRIAPISIKLYPSLEEYQEQTQMDLANASMRCLETGPEIYAPVEGPPNPITWRSGAGAPVHEMAHALVCQALGTKRFHQIPDWFHEGTAEILRNETQPKIIRTMNRIRVWTADDQQLPPSHQICRGNPGNLAKERNWFYLTATEFTRALESRKDQDILNQVILDLQAGSTFEESLRGQLGKPCEELYREWLESW